MRGYSSTMSTRSGRTARGSPRVRARPSQPSMALCKLKLYTPNYGLISPMHSTYINFRLPLFPFSNKGVKVDLGIPFEMWDKPSAEVTHLKTQCDDMMEKYESEIEDWYNRRQGNIPLEEYLCQNIVLKNKDFSCLFEHEGPDSVTEKDEL